MADFCVMYTMLVLRPLTLSYGARLTATSVADDLYTAVRNNLPPSTHLEPRGTPPAGYLTVIGLAPPAAPCAAPHLDQLWAAHEIVCAPRTRCVRDACELRTSNTRAARTPHAHTCTCTHTCTHTTTLGSEHCTEHCTGTGSEHCTGTDAVALTFSLTLGAPEIGCVYGMAHTSAAECNSAHTTRKCSVIVGDVVVDEAAVAIKKIRYAASLTLLHYIL